MGHSLILSDKVGMGNIYLALNTNHVKKLTYSSSENTSGSDIIETLPLK